MLLFPVVQQKTARKSTGGKSPIKHLAKTVKATQARKKLVAKKGIKKVAVANTGSRRKPVPRGTVALK